MKKQTFFLISILFCSSLFGLTAKPLWKVTTGLVNPESAHFCEETNRLYVSNVNGAADAKDGNGFISVLTLEGKVEKLNWAKGLNAPKGLRCNKTQLWVTDIGRVLAYDLKTAKQVKSVTIPGAKFLNDIALSKDGTVFVSDTAASKIYTFDGKSIAEFVSGPEFLHPNGLLVIEDKLYVAAWGKEMAADFSTKGPGEIYSIGLQSKQRTPQSTIKGHLDGLEKSTRFGWLATDWMAGKVFAAATGGNVTELLSGLKGAADIGWIESRNLLVVPEMGASALHAFEVSAASTAP